MKCIPVSDAVHALIIKTQAKLALERGDKLSIPHVLDELLKDKIEKE